MKVVIGECPLGAKCETVGRREGEPVIIRCPWYVKLKGKDPNSGDEVDEFACAIAWTPVLQINIANEARKNVAATEDLRNRVVPLMSSPPSEKEIIRHLDAY